MVRAVTFPGIASAMAEQWGDYVADKIQNYDRLSKAETP